MEFSNRVKTCQAFIVMTKLNFSLNMQIVIVQFGGRAFSTEALTVELWLWCILFGSGVLLWGQVVTSIPTKKLPKNVFS